MLIDSPAIANQVRRMFDVASDPANSCRVSLEPIDNPEDWTGRRDRQDERWLGEPDASWWRRFQAFPARILPVEDQL